MRGYMAHPCDEELTLEKKLRLFLTMSLRAYNCLLYTSLQNYIDYEAYGRDVAMDENGSFTDQGYVRDTGDRLSLIHI